MRIMRGLILAPIISALAFSASAKGPAWNGLAGIAVHPSENCLMVGGDNRVIYKLDSETFETKKRYYYEVKIGLMYFSKDGSTLVVEDETDRVSFLDAKTLERKSEMDMSRGLCVADDADHGVVYFNNWQEPKLVVFELGTGETVHEVVMAEGIQLAGHGISPDGKILAWLTTGKESENETKVEYSDVPKDLAPEERALYQQKNDGRVSTLTIQKMAGGSEPETHEVFLTSDERSTTMAVTPDGSVVVLTYSDVNLIVSPGGSVMDFKMGTFGYGRAIASGGKGMILGGLNDAYFSGEFISKPIHSELENIKGWPEYFETFAQTKDGGWYAATSAYRIHKIETDGTVSLSKPVF